MKDKEKTNKQFIDELKQVRRRIAELEALEAEHRRAEETLWESKERYQALFKNTLSCVYVHDFEGRFLDANDAALNLLEYTRKEIPSLTLATLLDQDQMSVAMQRIEEIKRTGSLSKPLEYKLRNKNGDDVWVEVESSLVYRDGKPYAILGIARDITERKQMEEALQSAYDELKESETRYRTLLDNLDLGMSLIDADHNILMASAAEGKQFKKPLSEFIGKKCFREFEKRDAVCPHCPGVRAMATGQPAEAETEGVRNNGSRYNVRVQAFPVFGDDGTVTGFIEIYENITERKRMEEALRESAEKYRIITSTAMDGFAEIDLEGRFLDVNEESCRMSGYSRDEHLKMSIADIEAIETPDTLKRRIQKIIETGSDRFESLIRRKDGRIIDIEASSTFFPQAGHLLVFHRDITERKRAEEALRESEEKYRRVVERANDGIAIIQDGILRYANPALEKMSGYTAEEALDTPFKVYIHPDDRSQAVETYNRRIAGDKQIPAGYQARLLHKDGSRIDVEASGSVITYHGKPADLAIIRDITERKLAEEALREGEATLRALINAPTDSVLLLDSWGVILDLNKIAAERLGKRRNELIGTLADDFLPEDIAKRRRSLISQSMETSRAVRFEDERDGIWFDTVAYPITDKDGAVSRLAIIARDITERKQAENALQRSYDQLRETFIATVNALASTVEMKDPYTAGHQRWATRLACAIAKEMDLADEKIEGIRMAGLIHDIGKINIPAEILSKPGHLTEIQYNMVKIHPQVGCDILREIKFPWPVAQIVLQHHERMDGSGYPHGLSGAEIILEARILSVADTVEAMSSHRPYRPAHGIERALEEISQNRGTLYDPDVVDACLRLFEKGFRFD